MPCTTLVGPATTAKRQERSGTAARGAGASPGYFHTHGSDSALPATIPRARRQRAPRLLHCCAAEQHVHPCRICLWQHPPSSSPSTAEAHPSTVPASGTPVPTQPLFSIPPAALRISDTPRRPGRGDRAVQHGSCVPLPGDGIHQPPAHSPSPDLGMAIPRLGPSPGNAACQQAEPGGRVEGSREG